MAEYISRDDLLNAINSNVAEAHNERCSQLLEAILNAPTADVAEVVRCKDCKHSNDDGTICRYSVGRAAEPEHFCSYGTPKERGGRSE